MPLSANSVFHFTSSRDSLVGILQNNFKIKYCKEIIHFPINAREYRVPMVSFCDIPLSEIKNHIRNYGGYGIGLTKEWAKRSKLNPVLYIETDSHLMRSIELAYKSRCTGKPLKSFNAEEIATADILRYIKPYEGELIRKAKAPIHYRFSDEREWRFVPEATDSEHMIATNDFYVRNENKFTDFISDKRLEFEPNDIKYVIINSESEIDDFVKILQESKGKKYSYNDVNRLTTRLITVEQIENDI